jgi:hypothetical protein
MNPLPTQVLVWRDMLVRVLMWVWVRALVRMWVLVEVVLVRVRVLLMYVSTVRSIL